jgi:hypothetical protein
MKRLNNLFVYFEKDLVWKWYLFQPKIDPIVGKAKEFYNEENYSLWVRGFLYKNES